VTDDRWRIRENSSGLEIALHVQPRARRNGIAGMHNGALRLKISAPPVDDAANRAVLQFFSSLLDIPKSRLRIVSGEKSREKILRIEGIPFSRLLTRLPPGLV
jgi:uncharacterized protein